MAEHLRFDSLTSPYNERGLSTQHMVASGPVFNMVRDALTHERDAIVRRAKAAEIVHRIDDAFGRIAGLDFLGNRARFYLERSTALKFIAEVTA